MILQHYQKAARKADGKAVQKHKVQELTYIAPPFFSVKERRLRTDEKQEGSSWRPTFKKKRRKLRRPQSASVLSINTRRSAAQRTAVDVSTFHRKPISEMAAVPMSDEQLDQEESNEHDKERAIRSKIKNLFAERELLSSNDSDARSESQSESEEEMEDMSHQRQMEMTEKMLVERVERLKRERMELENAWKGHGQAHPQSQALKLMEDGMEELRINTQEDEDDECRLTDDEDDLDSVMSFSDGDSVGDADSDDEPEGTKTLSKLRKRQTSNLAHLEEVYHRRRTRMDRDDLDLDEETEEKVQSVPTPRQRRPQTAPSRDRNAPRNRITIPKPFGFDKSAKAKAAPDTSISKRRFREYLAELKREEDAHINFEFKANPVPVHAVTSKMDIRPKRQAAPEKQPFKAKDVPWFVKVKLYDAMQAEESTKRKDSIRLRADKLLSKSALPPRMQKYETKENRQLKRQKMRRIKKEALKEYTFAPKINHIVPDFEKEQEKFVRQLEQRKQARATVKPEGFSFCDRPNDGKKELALALAEDEKKKTQAMEEQRAVQAKLKENRRKIKNMIGRPPKIMPKSTRKFDEAVSLKRSQERKQKREAFSMEETLRNKNLKIKEKWRGVLDRHLVDNTSELEHKRLQSQREARQAQKEDARNYKRQKKEMMERVANRPLLVEEGRMKMERESARKKALVLVRQSLKKAGIKEQALGDFFDEDELEQLKKMKQL